MSQFSIKKIACLSVWFLFLEIQCFEIQKWMKFVSFLRRDFFLRYGNALQLKPSSCNEAENVNRLKETKNKLINLR